MPKPIARRAALSRPAPMPSHDGPSVDELRIRTVSTRVQSAALASVIASLAYSVPENLRGPR